MPSKRSEISVAAVTDSAKAMFEKVRKWVDDKTGPDAMPDAVKMLEEQHMMVRAMFAKLSDAEARERRALFDELVTALAMHTEMEEKVFYPAVKQRETEAILLESVEDHLVVKRLLADLIEMSPSDDRWIAKLKVLRENVEHHAREEEKTILPRALILFDSEYRMALAQEMTAVAVDLLEGKEEDVRASVFDHLDEAASI